MHKTIDRSLGVEGILRHNKEQSDIFCSNEALLSRELFRGNCPTEVCFFKCSDGRLNGPVWTDTPPGIIKPWRTIGGNFNLGWTPLNPLFHNWVEDAFRRNNFALAVCTYHFSESDYMTPRTPEELLGCYGCNFDIEIGKRQAWTLAEQIDYLYGYPDCIQRVYTCVAGMETDKEALVIHGQEKGQVLNLSELPSTTTREQILAVLDDFFPHWPATVRHDFSFYLHGNLRHIAVIKAANRPVEHLNHREWILGYGRVFGSLHAPNDALIVGQLGHADGTSIGKASAVIMKNKVAHRIDDALYPVLLVTIPSYTKGRVDRFAELTAKEAATYAYRELLAQNPEFIDLCQYLVGVTDVYTRLLHQVSWRP